jgi:glutathione peroxidase
MNESIYDIPLRRIDGTTSDLGAFRGKVVLVVNVASACGLTPQYAQLEKLYEERKDAGLVVAGFPANDFKAQEPGSNQEIAEFCSTKFGVTFPMFEKISVKGPNQHPLYKRLIEAQPHAREKPGSDFRAKQASYGLKPDNETDILWNFEKFLIDRSGRVIDRFTPNTVPDDAVLKDAIEKALGA